MKFLCLCYYDVKLAAALTPAATEALSAACEPHYAAWEGTGKLGSYGALSESSIWRSIRPTDASNGVGSPPVVSAGPYRGLAQQIGAFFFVEATDIEEAVAVAAKHPDAHVVAFSVVGSKSAPVKPTRATTSRRASAKLT